MKITSSAIRRLVRLRAQYARGARGGLALALAAFSFQAACGDGEKNTEDDGGSFVSPVSVDCTHVGSGMAYNVGEGEAYATVGEVPWSALGAGDTVRIHWRQAAYHEKILISNSGAEGQPLRVCGVPGPEGQMPVIDGVDATTSPNQDWPGWLPIQDVGVVVITPDRADRYGFRPEWITLEGLVVRGAHPDNSYTNSDGDVRPYESHTAGLYVVPAAHLIVRGNVFTDNALGLFTLSKDETDGHVVEDLTIEGNYFYGNGIVGSDTKHNCYTQGLGILVQFNRFGRLRPGALGGNFKDRSAGTVVRYNWIEGGARQIDLVDAQEHIEHALADPRYRETFVYGNMIINVEAEGDSGHPVHYGGDTIGYEQNFRKGTLYFHNNTIITTANADDRWRTSILELPTNDETADVRNNIIIRRGDTNMSMLSRAGRLTLGVNWISSDTAMGYDDFDGTIEGQEQIVSGNDPMLDELYRPAAGSPAIDAAQSAAAGPEILGEYVLHQQGTERVVNGSALDLGAFEAR